MILECKKSRIDSQPVLVWQGDNLQSQPLYIQGIDTEVNAKSIGCMSSDRTSRIESWKKENSDTQSEIHLKVKETPFTKTSWHGMAMSAIMAFSVSSCYEP